MKYAIKRLTASDLTFFTWHFRNNSNSNQKAINLNADVFIKKLYPALPEIIIDSNDPTLPVSLYLYGPGLKSAYLLQRKIVKSASSKNWRLNGEFVSSPVDDDERFNDLRADDIVVMGFAGESKPKDLHFDFLARDNAYDKKLYDHFNALLDKQSMRYIEPEELEKIIAAATPDLDHPIRTLFVDEDLIEIAEGDAEIQLDLFIRMANTRVMTPKELFQAKKRAEDIGKIGEELVSVHFNQLLEEEAITKFDWVSKSNAIAPYDFSYIVGEKSILIDVKSTSSKFGLKLHISMAELKTMASSENYQIYRVYELNENGGKLRKSENLNDFAKKLIDTIHLPKGISIDSLSVDPNLIDFKDEIDILFPEN